MLASRLSPPVFSAVVLVIQASRASGFSTLTTVRGTSFQARPLAVRGVSSQGGAGGRGLAPVLRKGALSPSFLRMASSTAGPPAAKDKMPLPDVIGLEVVSTQGVLVTLTMDEFSMTTVDLQGRTVNIPGAGNGVVVWQRLPLVFALMDNAAAAAAPVGTKGELVTGDKLTIPVGAEIMGKTVDFRGRVLGEDVPGGEDRALLFGASTLQADMATISQPMHTGLTAVDALTPIGKGQNMLILSDPTLGKMDLAMDALCNQVAQGNPAVYVCTKGDHEAVAARLKSLGILDKTVIVTSKTDAAHDPSPVECVAAAAAGASIGYHLCSKGQDVLMVLDALEFHQRFWESTERQILKLVEGTFEENKDNIISSGNSEMRAFYASLFQRVGKLNNKAGGGSLTMFVLMDRPSTDLSGNTGEYTMADFDPTVYGANVRARLQLMVDRGIKLSGGVLEKLNIPAPGEGFTETRFRLQFIQEMMSLSDGQINLCNKLHVKGMRPAIDAATSLTRIGIGADNLAVPSSLAMRAVAASLRFNLAQVADLPVSDKTPAAELQRARARSWYAALHQDFGAVRPFPDVITALFAASEGFLDKLLANPTPLPTAEAAVKVAAAVAFVRAKCSAEIAELEKTMDISSKCRTALKEALAEHIAANTA
mmetsp:Transcript_24569/g.56379  ORF Transcript_24569/g.56379 Transcript_24569/m.56379 type:complete len:652 (+) Transcript_24569:126-2081(+)